MVYIKSQDMWYCTKCQDKGDICSPWMKSEEKNPNRGFIKAAKKRQKSERIKNKSNTKQ